MANGVIAAGLLAGSLILFLIVAIFALIILAVVFWILMIVNCATRNFKKDTDKIVWILVIIFTGIIGALIYYFIVKAKDKKPSKR